MLLQRGEYTGYDIIVTTNNSPALGRTDQQWLAHLPLDQSMMNNFRAYAGLHRPQPAPGIPGIPTRDGLAVGLDRDADTTRRVIKDPGETVAVLFDKKYAYKVGMMSDPYELGSVGLLAMSLMDPATSTEADWRKAATPLLQKQKSEGIVRGYYNQDYIDNLKSGRDPGPAGVFRGYLSGQTCSSSTGTWRLLMHLPRAGCSGPTTCASRCTRRTPRTRWR